MSFMKVHVKLKFKKLHQDAKLPTQAKKGDVGFDLYSVQPISLKQGQTSLISTGLQLADFPSNDSGGNSLYMQFLSRSGLASKGIVCLGGVIDATYRGELKVILHNTGEWRQFAAGERIAQFVIAKVVTNDDFHTVLLEESEEVTSTARGADGIGSTGA